MAKTKAETPTLAFVTTCKGRLHHLRETLPTMTAQTPDELIVVDYGCPDGTCDWVEANVPAAKVVRASQPGGGFNLARARNIGAAAATSDWLLFIDADTRCAPDLASGLRQALRAGAFLSPQTQQTRQSIEVSGCCAVAAADFAAVEGYDEVFEGWGREDRDFYLRLRLAGRKHEHFPLEWLDPIVHGDDERDIPAGMAGRRQNLAVNACYGDAKLKLSLFRGGKGNLELAERRQIMATARRAVAQWFESGAKQPLAVNFPAQANKPEGLPERLALQSRWTLTVVVYPHKLSELADLRPPARAGA